MSRRPRISPADIVAGLFGFQKEECMDRFDDRRRYTRRGHRPAARLMALVSIAASMVAVVIKVMPA